MSPGQEVNLIVDNISSKLDNVVNSLAIKLGVAADTLLPILLKQARIDGVMALLWSLTGLLIFLFGFYICYKFYVEKIEVIGNYSGNMRTTTRATEWEEVIFILWLAPAFCFVAGGLLFINYFSVAMNALLNPQFYILKQILSTLK